MRLQWRRIGAANQAAADACVRLFVAVGCFHAQNTPTIFITDPVSLADLELGKILDR